MDEAGLEAFLEQWCMLILKRSLCGKEKEEGSRNSRTHSISEIPPVS